MGPVGVLNCKRAWQFEGEFVAEWLIRGMQMFDLWGEKRMNSHRGRM